ncbi:MAG: hypothetical protein PHQ35_11610 [Phycisphaerae bacterium]|nr:hypothetical protein [Phycisphaerae bacterium]
MKKVTNSMTPHSIELRNESSKASKKKLVGDGGANISATVNTETARQWNELKIEIGSDNDKPAKTKETLAYAISVAHSITCGVRRTDNMGLLLRAMVARWDDRQAIDDLLYEALDLIGFSVDGDREREHKNG